MSMEAFGPAPKTRYARVGEVRIAYQVVGEGEADLVLLLPWLNQIEHLWEEPGIRRMLEQFSSIGRLILFDRRGAGLSDPVATPPTLEERMEDLLAVLEATDSQRPFILAQQEGGTMAVLFAATHPDRLRGLVLYGAYAAGDNSESMWWLPSPEGLDAIVEVIGEHWGEGLLLSGLAPSRLGDVRFAEWLAKLERLAASPTTAQGLTMIMSVTDVRSVLPDIRVPTLVLHRTEDAMVDVRHGRYLAENIPGARLVEFPGVDHLPSVGDVSSIVQEVARFVNGSRFVGDPRRRVATLLFTDIVGSTDTAATLGDHRWGLLLDKHDDVVRQELAQFGGREVKSTGDGFLAAFDGPVRAVQCARSIGQKLSLHDIDIRAGLHTGEIEWRLNDVAGIAVHVAARVMDTGGSGDVVVSSIVKDLVAGSGITFSPRGEHDLKGVPGHWPLFAVDDQLAYA